MIIRKNNLNVNSKEVQFAICYSVADVKSFLKRLISTMYSPQTSEVGLNLLLKDLITEREIRQVAERAEWAFANFEQPWRSQLSGWLWASIIREGFVQKSASNEFGYFFSAKSLELVKVKREK